MSPAFPVHIQGRVLRIPGIPLPGFAYGALTLYGGPFQGTSARPARGYPGPILHIPYDSSSQGSVWPLPVSVAPTPGIAMLLSFPPLTKMFQFRGFPLPQAGRNQPYGSAGRSPQEVPFGNPGFHGSMRLPRAFRSLARPSSAREPSHPPPGLRPLGPLSLLPMTSHL